MIIAIILIYMALVLVVGTMGHKLFRRTGEDYFVASRSIGPFILLMSLFGTNMTSVAILGASGEAYHEGIGVFGQLASASALIIPSVFFFVGTRVWTLGKQHGYITQAQYFRQRWNSDILGLLLFLVLGALMIPYLLVGVMGSGITLHEITNNQIPEWVGALLVCAVILAYVTYGGMRSTAWVNTLQTLVFMSFGVIAFVVIVRKMGGLANALDIVSENNPDLLMRGEKIKPLQFLTYTCIPLSVGMFPHMFMHWLTAKRAESFRYPLMFYPMCIAAVWVPSVLLGILGSIDFPGLKGPAANSVLINVIGKYSPDFLAGMLAAGVLAAIMSSLDSQVLSLGSMFTHDIVRHYGFHDKMSDKQQVLVGRLFVAGILAICFALSLISNRSIFKLGVWSFTGFASLFPIVAAALFWKRSTKYGAMASILSVAVTWIYFFIKGSEQPGYTIGGTGIMPVAVILAVSAATMIIVSLMTKPPDEETLKKFFSTDGHIDPEKALLEEEKLSVRRVRQ
ncbi:sodium:solute symporter family protein [candidate division KSB1 bacterium]|nr:sodium:solute symporter family protein [candidate division KSB1 bacterium]